MVGAKMSCKLFGWANIVKPKPHKVKTVTQGEESKHKPPHQTTVTLRHSLWAVVDSACQTTQQEGNILARLHMQTCAVVYSATGSRLARGW